MWGQHTVAAALARLSGEASLEWTGQCWETTRLRGAMQMSNEPDAGGHRAVTRQDVSAIARLAALPMSAARVEQLQQTLSGFFERIDRISDVMDRDVEPPVITYEREHEW